MHKQFVSDLLNSNYQNTANWILSDDLIEPEYLEGSEAESPGTYVWIANDSEVLYIGEYGFTVKYRMNQHWASWPRTTRSNQKEPDAKKQKGDIIFPHLKSGNSVKILSKPATIVHLQCPHPLRSQQTDVPDMLRADTKSYEEASLLETFTELYEQKPVLNGTKGSKGHIISEGYNYSASSKGADVNLAAPETDNMTGMYIPSYTDSETGC